MDGDSLEAALRDYGPAAIDDLLPRLRAIADTLDVAHAAGRVHGALHPQNIFISAETTHVTGLDPTPSETDTRVEPPVRLPYSAPEMVAGGAARPASDQFALAAIAFEWLFGRRVSGPAVRPVEVRSLPGVDREAMSKAFTRALAPEPAQRFASCTAFFEALGGAVIPVLPLGGESVDEVPIGPLVLADPPIDDLAPMDSTPFSDPDLSIVEPRFATIEPRRPPPDEPVTSWQPSAAYTPAKPVERFGGGMLIAALLVGMVVGFAAGYMARPRALQSGPVQTMAPPSNGTGGSVASAAQAPAASAVARAPSSEPRRDLADLSAGASARVEAASGREGGPKAPEAQTSIGRILVRSTPTGASVEVDGVARGITPLALRDLELGSRTIAVARSGYIAEERRIVLTRARPSRSLEIRLAAAASAAPRSAAAAEGGSGARQRPAPASTGTLVVESRPAGAAVLINGKPGGNTPATIDGLAPGEYRINLSLAGYQSFATTVRVVAGARTRAAASLSAQE